MGEMAVFFVLMIFFWMYITCVIQGFVGWMLSHNQSCAKDHQLGQLDFAS